MNTNDILNKITDLLAYHKQELVGNIKKLGYQLKDTNDETITILILKNIVVDSRLENMLISMFEKYDEKKSNASGETKITDKIKKYSKIGMITGVVLAIGGLALAFYFIKIKK